MSTPVTAVVPEEASRERRALLAIVPARGGSKGVPFKNMRRLGDRPLVLVVPPVSPTVPVEP